MKWENKNVLIVGMARSGVAAAEVLSNRGSNVTVTDQKPAAELRDALNRLEKLSIKTITGGYPDLNHERFDLVITSPGVAKDSGILTSACEKGIPVWSELELAARFLKDRVIVAITGTNGKTTTTALVGEILKHAGYETAVAGNIGRPLVQEAEKAGEKTVFAVEVSSFQLEWVREFRPKVAVLLNITPDHLDRHKTLENYVQTKSGIFLNQSRDDFTVINYDDHRLRSLENLTPGKVIFFSARHILEKGVFVDRGVVTADLGEGRKQIIKAADIAIPGPHNLENALAAAAAALALGVDVQCIAAALRSFQGVRHRLEKVGEVNGITFINDSKGTNPDATIKALYSFDRDIILIAGGRNKGGSFDELALEIKERVKGLVLLGESAEELARSAEKAGFTDYVLLDSFQNVVERAFEMAGPGDIVLLSPACASWDMFRDYEERGDEFKRQVEELIAEKK